MTGPPIPVTVVGGYLGAGKTTLLNRLLRAGHGRRIAVIVNDFGAVALDGHLIEAVDGNVVSLANGCVCCAAVDGLAAALADLAAMAPRPEHVVIEASGVGDPWAVAQWGRTPGFDLDGVVVVIDPETLAARLADPYVGTTVAAQIRAADVLVMTRTDIAAGPLVDEASRTLSELTSAPIVDGVTAGLDLLVPIERHGVASAGGHAEYAVDTFVPRAMPRELLADWLDAAPPGVVRVKGLVDGGEGSWLVGQRSGWRVEVRRHRGPLPPEATMTVIALPGFDATAVAAWCAQLRD